MLRSWRLLVCLVLFSLASPGAAAEARRVALVIGNSNYESMQDLRNPRNDAMAVARLLERGGFELIGGGPALDVGRLQLTRLAIELGAALQAGDLAVVFYAGHGMTHEGRNYLIPVDDGELAYREELAALAYPADGLLDAMRERGGGFNLLILDACRNNPLPRRFPDRDGAPSRGLVSMVATADTQRERDRNTMVLFSADPGQVASDGHGANSPFTTALLAALSVPGLEATAVLKRTGKELETHGMPLPYWEGRFTDDWILIPPQPALVAPMAPDDPDCPRIIPMDADRSMLSAKAAEQLACHANHLRKYPAARITVEGHAEPLESDEACRNDGQAPPCNREYALGLGERRGNAVRDALLALGGNGGQVSVVSYGQERPFCEEDTAACRERNRRVEIVYTSRGLAP